MRNPFDYIKTKSKEEIRLHVQKVHTDFPVIWDEHLPDELVEQHRECKQAFLEHYWKLSKEKEFAESQEKR